MKKRIFILGTAAVLSVLCGCFKFPTGTSTETKIYDLHAEKMPDLNIPVKVDAFSSLSPVRYKMLTRKGEVLEKDEFNQWVQPPAVMLQRIMVQAFACTKNGAPWVLKGKIVSFEENGNKRTAVLDVIYILIAPDGTKVLTHRIFTEIPIQGKGKAAFAGAMQQACSRQQKDLLKFMESVCR